MDCTEFSLYGNPRPPRSKEGYDTSRFKQRYREIAKKTCGQMSNFLERGNVSGFVTSRRMLGHKLGPMFGGFAAHARSCYYY